MITEFLIDGAVLE